jgi:hypothetical protein
MSMKTFAALIVLVCLSVATAHAGPANRRFRQSGQRPQPINLSGFGSPLPAVANSLPDLQIFATGQINFKEIETVPQVGPIFNGVSCAGCHSQPAIGGAGLFINEIRVRNNTAPGPVHIFAVDNMLRGGAQSQGGTSIFPGGMEAEPIGCQITAPGCALSSCQQEEMTRTTFNTSLLTCDPSSADFADNMNCVVGRAATPLFGLGLVEAVSSRTLNQLAQSEPAPVRGVAKQITELGQLRVARFGWKDDHATLRGFAGDAYLNEMGITNPDNPTEVSSCAVNQSQYGVTLQTAAGVEDGTDSDGRADIDRFADFMRALNPPPILAQDSSAQNGARLFQQTGCAGCHATQLTTDPNPASFIPATTGGVPITSNLNLALARQTFHPFSDFLLHDMGSLGDGITSGAAGPTLIRTVPLWGIRAKSEFLHDGRAPDLPTAIGLHDGQGKAASTAFQALSPQQQTDLVNFLNTI